MVLVRMQDNCVAIAVPLPPQPSFCDAANQPWPFTAPTVPEETLPLDGMKACAMGSLGQA